MPVFDTRLTPELIERYTRSAHWGTETFYQNPGAPGRGPPGPGGDHRSTSTHFLWAASCRR